MKPGHWAIRDDEIVAWVRVANQWQPIAKVEFGEERPVRQMLRYAKLGEDVERIADQMRINSLMEDGKTREEAEKIMNEYFQDWPTLSPEEAAGMIYKLVKDCVKDIMQRENPINAPEVKRRKSPKKGN